MIREPVVVPPASPHPSWPSPQLSVPCQLPSLRPFVVSRPPFAPSHVLSFLPFQDASEHRAVYSLVSLWRSEVSMDRPVHGRTWTDMDMDTSMDCYKSNQGIRRSP